jgi:osmotically-inducible protein OsmY
MGSATEQVVHMSSAGRLTIEDHSVRGDGSMRPIVENFPVAARMAVAEDDILTEQICQALDRSGYGQLRHVRVAARPNGRVRLDGAVSSFYLKQIAQTVVLSVPGVTRIHNELQVSAKSPVSWS